MEKNKPARADVYKNIKSLESWLRFLHGTSDDRYFCETLLGYLKAMDAWADETARLAAVEQEYTRLKQRHAQYGKRIEMYHSRRRKHKTYKRAVVLSRKGVA